MPRAVEGRGPHHPVPRAPRGPAPPLIGVQDEQVGTGLRSSNAIRRAERHRRHPPALRRWPALAAPAPLTASPPTRAWPLAPGRPAPLAFSPVLADTWRRRATLATPRHRSRLLGRAAAPRHGPRSLRQAPRAGEGAAPSRRARPGPGLPRLVPPHSPPPRPHTPPPSGRTRDVHPGRYAHPRPTPPHSPARHTCPAQDSPGPAGRAAAAAKRVRGRPGGGLGRAAARAGLPGGAL